MLRSAAYVACISICVVYCKLLLMAVGCVIFLLDACMSISLQLKKIASARAAAFLDRLHHRTNRMLNVTVERYRQLHLLPWIIIDRLLPEE